MSTIIATDKTQRPGVNRRMALKALAAIAAASQTAPLQAETSAPMSLARPGAAPCRYPYRSGPPRRLSALVAIFERTTASNIRTVERTDIACRRAFSSARRSGLP